MRYSSTFLIMLLLPAFCWSQASLSRQVFANGGNSSESNGLYVSFTVGEAIVGSSTVNNLTLNSGFQQGDLQVSTGITDLLELVDIQVYPNPTVAVLNIDLDGGDSPRTLQVDLVNNLGQILHSEPPRKLLGTESMQLDLQAYPSGHYFLRLLDKESGRLSTFKVEKY